MTAQITLKGYVVNYDDTAAVILSSGKVVANFSTSDEATALVQAMRWIKKRNRAPLETDKGVFDPDTLDKFGNVVKLGEPLSEPTDDSVEAEDE